MFKRILLLLAPLVWSSAVYADDITTILKQADRFRLAETSAQVETEVRLLKDGQLDKERRYTVYLAPGRRSLVLFKHASEQGQKVLMLDDKFWMIMPNSRRPIRITPMQKLLGEASTGDIATMTWSEDYDGKIIGEEDVNGTPALHLDLQAVRKGASYSRIELYVAKGDYRPLKADLYVASGKLAKQASFTAEEAEGEIRVTEMTLFDRIQTDRETVIRYLYTTPRAIPDKFYNPAFLVRNNLDEL